MRKQSILFSCTLAIFLVIAVSATYSNHFHNSFHFDDSHTIVNNIYIKSIHNIPLFFKDATSFSSLPTNQSYRPVVSASLALDYWMGNGLEDTFYFHLSTFLSFLLQGLLMFFLYRRIYATAITHDWVGLVAFFAIAWYLLHPAGAETINYVIARSDSLSALSIVGALVFYAESNFCRRFYLYLLPVVVGLLAKPVTAVFAPLLFFYILLIEEQISLTAIRTVTNRPGLIRAAKNTLPALVCCLLMLLFIKMMDPPTWSPGGTSLFHYLITQPYVVLSYFMTFFLPLNLSADTDLKPFISVADPRFLIGILFVAGLLLAAVWTSRKQVSRPVAFGILWFLLTLFPTSVIPLSEVMNDHRIFLPYIGLMLAVSWAFLLLIIRLRKSMQRPPLFAPVIVCITVTVLALYAWGTYQRNQVWKTDESLWYDVTIKSPNNGRGLMNYGLTQMAKGKYETALDYFTRALEISPNYTPLHINLAVVKNATGHTSEAENFFTRAITLGPDYPAAYFFYARFLAAHDRPMEAIPHLEKALKLSSAHVDARHLLMDILFDQEDTGRLKALAEQTASIVPNDPKAVYYLLALEQNSTKRDLAWQEAMNKKTPEAFINLSLNYYQAGLFPDTIRAARAALVLRQDFDLAYNNICAAHNEMRQWDKAIEACEKALKLNSNNQIARNNLAWAKQQAQNQDSRR